MRLPLVICVVAPVVLSGCGLGFPFLPATAEPVGTVTAEQEERSLHQALLAVMPAEMKSAFPNGHAPGAARFLMRTLETAPDGEKRQWQSIDRAITLVVRPNVTTVNVDTLCRIAHVTVVSPGGSKQFEYRACRLKNGTWVY